jgi:hypothetical protein
LGPPFGSSVNSMTCTTRCLLAETANTNHRLKRQANPYSERSNQADNCFMHKIGKETFTPTLDQNITQSSQNI